MVTTCAVQIFINLDLLNYTGQYKTGYSEQNERCMHNLPTEAYLCRNLQKDR